MYWGNSMRTPSQTPEIFEGKMMLPLMNQALTQHIDALYDEIKEHLQQDVYQMDFTADTPSQREKEQYYLGFVRTGNVDAIESLVKDVKTNGISPILMKNIQNNDATSLFLQVSTCITLCCREAIDAGVPEALAYALSDSFTEIAKREMQNLEKLALLTYTSSLSFAETVRDWVICNHNPAITNCYNYIFNHIQEPITLENLSKACNLSPNYVSDLFKKELGIRPIAFIRTIKLQASQTMLKETIHSISDIAAIFSFPSASAYTTQFREEYGITPLQYRKNPQGAIQK